MYVHWEKAEFSAMQVLDIFQMDFILPPRRRRLPLLPPPPEALRRCTLFDSYGCFCHSFSLCSSGGGVSAGITAVTAHLRQAPPPLQQESRVLAPVSPAVCAVNL